MEAVFFIASRDVASGVNGSHDLVDDPITDPLPLEGLGGLRRLTALLTPDGSSHLEQLHDATCQSFPVWSFDRASMRALEALSDDEVDATAARWLESQPDWTAHVDLYGLATRLTEIRDALQAGAASGQHLFVLLEEKAF